MSNANQSNTVLDQGALFEVFVRSKQGLEHKHCGSVHAADEKMALRVARDVYTRRQEGVSIWVVRSSHIVASQPQDAASFFDPMQDKVYRTPRFIRFQMKSSTCN